MAEIKCNAKQKKSVLDVLLGGTVPNVEKELPTSRYRVDRLSDLAGQDVIFTLRALPYGKVHDLERFTQNSDIHILLAGCVYQNARSGRARTARTTAAPAKNIMIGLSFKKFHAVFMCGLLLSFL